MSESQKESVLWLRLLECRDLLYQVLRNNDIDALNEYGDEVISRADEALGREKQDESQSPSCTRDRHNLLATRRLACSLAEEFRHKFGRPGSS